MGSILKEVTRASSREKEVKNTIDPGDSAVVGFNFINWTGTAMCF